ncbi:oxidoreductase [Adlercreutzia sp. ZJ154]|uniref:oxidoreductase n=1 Tax=Adlercreutzia sp. ZJ154 TaxID=2709790 RepID=UPI0013EC1D68|nr:oxidoreductase [Adlercreutzia sp. ZJ154]
MSDYGMIIDYKYCTGCHTCEVACRQEKDFPLDQWGIKLTSEGPAKLGDEWYWMNIPVPSNLCDLCIERIEEGKKPACAHHCLAQCIEVVPIEKIGETMKTKEDGVVCFIP